MPGTSKKGGGLTVGSPYKMKGSPYKQNKKEHVLPSDIKMPYKPVKQKKETLYQGGILSKLKRMIFGK